MKQTEITDEEIIGKFKKENAWGISTSVDLKNCNPNFIRDKEKIHEFIIQLCNLIDTVRFGEPIIVDFGEDKRVSGYSFTQLIETSLVSGHLVNQTNAAYIDIFSCKDYPAHKAADFCKKFFEAEGMKVNILFRI